MRRNRAKLKKTRYRIRWRVVLPSLLLLLVSMLCIGALTFVQILNAGELQNQARDKRAVPLVISAVRGPIVDRNGNELAITDERYDVQLSPKNTRVNGGIFYRFKAGGQETETVTSDQAFAEIAAITGQQPSEIKEIVDKALEENPKSDFAYIKRYIDLNTLNKLKELRIPWMTYESVYNRVYPNGAVGGNLVGFMSKDGLAQGGVELSQNACLAGENGSVQYERSADGVPLPGSFVTTKEARNGGTLEMTIDRDLQWQIQQITNEARLNAEAEWVMQVVMDAKTGELLAVGEDGTVDPNNVQASDPTRRNSRAFTAPYEPGSTLKTLTASVLVNEGLADPSTQNATPGAWNPEPSVFFRDAFGHGIQQWTLAGIMVKSSNVGISMLGSRIPTEKRYEYMRKFGLSGPTHAGMPLESGGILRNWKDWDPQTRYNTMYGQGLSYTIIQSAGIYQTIANGGLRVPPKLVRGCRDEQGKLHPYGQDQQSVQVLKPEAAAQTTQMLETITDVSNYVGERIQIPGYRLAGKTGTAEQPDGKGGYRSDFVYSFAGFFPADNPRFVLVTSVGFPVKNKDFAALDAWKASASATIRRFNIPPSQGQFTPLPQTY
ncbi:MAG: penicillin-binding protein 2 [Microbacteriaceae bacterium]|nr:penicillin-binding protein 2 [Microbacteriaceae bacterium]